jgi:hypothetical protein
MPILLPHKLTVMPKKFTVIDLVTDTSKKNPALNQLYPNYNFGNHLMGHLLAVISSVVPAKS